MRGIGMSKDYCFCTLAVGKRYRAHAQLLAADLQKYAPERVLILLSDRPDEFEHFPNVRAFMHRLQSVKGYHDKRFVLEKAITLFESCIFVDADVRILGPIPEHIPFSPGLVPRYGCGIIKHGSGSKIRPAFRVIEIVAQVLRLDLEKVCWFHEFMFFFTRQAGKEKEFFELWESIAHYFESRGIYDGEGNVMGLAAAKVGLDITFYRNDVFPCFKDNIQKEKIKAGTASAQDMQAEFETHRTIEYPKRSLIAKIADRVHHKLSFAYRLLKAKLNIVKATLVKDPLLLSFQASAETQNKSLSHTTIGRIASHTLERPLRRL
jgi:hypothetical protein